MYKYFKGYPNIKKNIEYIYIYIDIFIVYIYIYVDIDFYI